MYTEYAHDVHEQHTALYQKSVFKPLLWKQKRNEHAVCHFYTLTAYLSGAASKYKQINYGC